MGRLDKLPLGGSVKVAGQRTESLRVGGFGTVGIPGIDAVVADSVARSLGLPAGNAIVVSAPHARLDTLTTQIKKLFPQSERTPPSSRWSTRPPDSGVAATTGAAGAPGPVAADGPGLTRAEVARFLQAAESRVGLPYVWGAAGPAGVRLLRPRAVVAGSGRRGDAAGGGRPGAHRADSAGRPAAAG